MASRNVSVPECSVHVAAEQYNTESEASFDLVGWSYYKTYVTSAQVLPGIIFGILCFIVAIVFLIWLFTLCCRRVGWASRRTRVHDLPAKARNKWAFYNLAVFGLVLGVIGTGTWALVEGLKTTDGSVDEFWGIVGSTRVKLVDISNTLQGSQGSIQALQASVTSSYNLVNSELLKCLRREFAADNQAAMTAFGVDVPTTLSLLQSFGNTLTSGLRSTQDADSTVQGTGIVAIENLTQNYEGKTKDAWSTWRRVALAVFFGLLILFGTVAGFLALLDRTPRSSAAATLLLWIWVGLVLLLGAGLLNIVWRVSRDGCLYGVDYASERIGGGGSTQEIFDYYFGRTSIPPQDVSQRLFGANLTQIIDTLGDPSLSNLVTQTQTPAGQILISTASSSDRAAINALPTRLQSLRGNLTTLNSEIQASNFSGIVGSVKGLICCSTTSALWSLWLASVVTGAIAGLLAVLTTVKVVTAAQRLGSYEQYTPQSPNGAILEGKRSVA